MLCLASIVSCANKPARSVTPSEATVQCTEDCWSVSKAFVKEHANLFNEVIRLRALAEEARKRPCP
jgi:hypothetical protein